jgi:hypothetical protein
MRVITTVVALTLFASAAGAQTAAKKPAASGATDKAAIEKTLIANEQKVSDAVQKGDVATFQSMVASDGWAIDETGLMSVADFVKMLKPGMSKITDSKLDSFKVQWVSADVAVLTYVWTGKGTFGDMPVKSPTLASTTWANRNGKWQAVFHQETPKSAAPPPAPAAPAKKK